MRKPLVTRTSRPFRDRSPVTLARTPKWCSILTMLNANCRRLQTCDHRFGLASKRRAGRCRGRVRRTAFDPPRVAAERVSVYPEALCAGRVVDYSARRGALPLRVRFSGLFTSLFPFRVLLGEE